LGIFAGLALILAFIGVYGVISYSVTQRTREIGIRRALGAGGADVLKLVLKEGLKLSLVGVVIGLIAAFALARLLESLLYGIRAIDPLTFSVTPLLLTAVALTASFIPAARAVKIDPMKALRYE
jgi:putative ABC transport system permease protein